MTEIKYSIGSGKTDNNPTPQVAKDFEAFYMAVCATHTSRNPKPIPPGASEEEKQALIVENKGLKDSGRYFACVYLGQDGKRGKRCNENAQARRFVVLDLDELKQGSLPAFYEFAKGLSCFAYESFSSTESTPKVRLVIESDRDILPNDMPSATAYCAEKLAQFLTSRDLLTSHTIDKTAGQAGRMFYTAPKLHAHGAGEHSSRLFKGEVLNADTAIKEGAPLVGKWCTETGSKRKRKKKDAKEGEGDASPSLCGAGNSAEKDKYVLNRLNAKGLFGKVIGNKWVINCPLRECHITDKGDHAPDTSTVYYPAGSINDNGDPQEYGAFHCFHEGCSDKEQAPYFEALGIDYAEYIKHCKGYKPEKFRGALWYSRRNGVVYASKEEDDTGTPVFSPIDVVSVVANASGGDTSLLVRWRHKYKNVRMTARIPYSALLSTEGVWGVLAENGLEVYRRTNLAGTNTLSDYLNAYPKLEVPFKTLVSATGWIDYEGARLFCTPGKTYGSPGLSEKIYYDGETKETTGQVKKGNVQDWIEHVGAHALRSTRVVFAICVAFASPCLRIVGSEGGGFNLYGQSSKGKTTALRAGASVYGAPGVWVKSWNTTATAFEKTVRAYNDLVICLDEAGESLSKSLGSDVYKLTNGRERGRARVRGDSIVMRETPPEPWRVLALSASELTLSQLMQVNDRTATAGQEVRLVDVPANAEGVPPEYGVFDRVREGESTKAIADALNSGVERAHGATGDEWLGYLAQHYDDARTALDTYIAEFKTRFEALRAKAQKEKLSTQGGRVLERFALAYSAGRLATERGLTGWTESQVFDACAGCASSVVDNFVKDKEIKNAINALYALITQRWDSFPASSFDKVNERLGVRYWADSEGSEDSLSKSRVTTAGENAPQENATQENAVLMLAQVFDKNVAPASANAVARYLMDKGVIPPQASAGGHGAGRVGTLRRQISGTPYKGYVLFVEKLAELAN